MRLGIFCQDEQNKYMHERVLKRFGTSASTAEQSAPGQLDSEQVECGCVAAGGWPTG